MNTCLPQFDTDRQARTQQLENNRSLYAFNYDYVPPIPMIDTVPHKEFFSADYTASRLASMAKLAPNMLASAAKRLFDPLDTLEEYDEMFVFLKKPGVAQNYRTDESFGEQRLSGPNPQAIRRLEQMPEEFPVSDAHIQHILGDQAALTRELKEGRLYFLDFPQLAHVKGGDYRGNKKFLPNPRALFCWNANSGRLWPVAVQISGAQGSRLFSPQDPELDWFTAKLCVQIADANHQELGTHFACTHVVMAPFAVVTNRQLAEKHPLHRLLKPHFRFMLFDNDLGRTRFIQPDGPVEHMMAGTLEESIGISAAFYKEWSLERARFSFDIANRKMEDTDVLPHYPFRDDGALVWESINKFVRHYLHIYYSTPENLSKDDELQNWARELSSHDGGRVAGMPAMIESLEQLADIVATIIYTCAPLHSSLNFSQYEYMGYVANMPYAAYHPIPESGTIDLPTVMKILPPYEQAALQLKWTEILTSYHYDRLGHYGEPFDDPQAEMTVKQFQKDLEEIESIIDERNLKRPLPYIYMKPSEIINSINT